MARTIIISSGEKESKENYDVVNHQIWLARQYYNKLIELERKRRR